MRHYDQHACEEFKYNIGELGEVIMSPTKNGS
jgi:hypothetical protein